jgi:hypothetical protein
MNHTENRRRRRRVARAALALIAFATVAMAADDETVKVEKGKVAVVYKRFDPAKPPDPPPPLEPGSAAVCEYQFAVETLGQYTTDPLAMADAAAAAANGRAAMRVEARVQRMTVRLQLNLTVWLPNGAAKTLGEHEEGHRQIAEAFYADAEKAARAAAARTVGAKFDGEGRDARAAGQAAMARANKQICDDYSAAVMAPCARAQAAFDRLTEHGLKASPTAKEAVEMAVKEGREK